MLFLELKSFQWKILFMKTFFMKVGNKGGNKVEDKKTVLNKTPSKGKSTVKQTIATCGALYLWVL